MQVVLLLREEHDLADSAAGLVQNMEAQVLVEGPPALEGLPAQQAGLEGSSTVAALVHRSFLPGRAHEAAVGTVIALWTLVDRGDVTTQFRNFPLDVEPPVLLSGQNMGLAGVPQTAGIASSIP